MDWQQFSAGLIIGLVIGVMSYAGTRIFYFYHDKSMRGLEEEPVVEAPKFRQRTAESDPNRHARVRDARVIARKSNIPESDR